MIIIGISGRRFAGKDTISAVLVKEYGFVQIAFADRLKQGLATIFNVPLDTFYNPKLKQTPLPELCGKTPEYLMTTLGTEWGQDLVHKNLWVNIALLRMMKEYTEGRERFVFSDVRFPSEAAALGKYNALFWKVISNREAKVSHRSEDPVRISYDHTFTNNGSIEELQAKVREAMNEQLGKALKGTP